MDPLPWIIITVVSISPMIIFLSYLLVHTIKEEKKYREQKKIDKADAMERTYRDCLNRLERLQLRD